MQPGSAKENLGAETKTFLSSKHHVEVQSCLASLVGLLSGESEKQNPLARIHSIILAPWGRSVFNRVVFISTASPGRKVTKQRFHSDVIKLALNKYTARSHTWRATDRHLLHNS